MIKTLPTYLVLVSFVTLAACSGSGSDGESSQPETNSPSAEPPLVGNPTLESPLRLCSGECDFDLRDDFNNEPVDQSRAIPAFGDVQADQVFDTSFQKITHVGQIPITARNPNTYRVRHYYSKANHLNADESYAIFNTNNGANWVYNTASWEPVLELNLVSGDPEIHWHPTDPDIFYVVDFVLNESADNRAFYRYQISSNTKTLLRDFDQYENASGQHEGNMDIAGRKYAMIGDLPNGNRELLVYDVLDDSIVGPVPVTVSETGDWVSVSPSGVFVVAMGNNFTSVYDAATLDLLYRLPDGSYGHADICYLEDGREAMVFDGADYPLDDNDRTINAAVLATGELIKMGTISWTQTPHISCRNTELPGWALVTNSDRQDGAPTYNALLDELYWLKLDGSQSVRRIAHHHSNAVVDYFGEAHAVSNKDGSKIIFASNWHDRDNTLSYLIDLSAKKTN